MNMDDSAQGVAGVVGGRPDMKRQLAAGMILSRGLCLSLCLVFLSGCSGDPASGELSLNQPGGLILSSPGFLSSRAIDEKCRVSALRNRTHSPT